MPLRTARRLVTHSMLASLLAFTAANALAQVQLIAPPAPGWRPPVLSVQGAGQPVRLSGLDISVDIAAGVAMTRVEMTFFNPNGRILEGKLQFPLAPGQIVSGFALDVDGKLRDAVPIEKARGQQVFEDIARRRVDPGLLQTTAGNNYELRVYPLNPGKTRTVVLTLLEPAAGRLQVPLAYAARVDRFALAVHSADASVPKLAGGALPGLRFERDGFGSTARTGGDAVALPAQPLVVELPSSSSNAAEISTAEHAGTSYFTAALPVAQRSVPRPLPRRVQIVWDASASLAGRRLDRELALLEAYFQRAPEIEVSLVRVADTAAPPELFKVRRGDWARLRAALEATVYDGASNLGAVRRDGTAGEVLWFSDGLANYGPAWRLAFPVPVYTINSAASSDPAALQALAEATGGRSIDLGSLSRAAAADALLKRGTEVVRISAVGATDIVVQPGSAAAGRLVFAGRLSERAAEVTVVTREAGAAATSTRTVHVEMQRHPRPLAALQWARLTLASLAGEARTNKARIRELGQRFGLATGETSLIVLEQAQDYARYEIEPPAELRSAVSQLTGDARRQKAQGDAARLAGVVRRWEARVAWWNHDFPKDTPPAVLQIGKAETPSGLAGLAASAQRLRRAATGNTSTAAPARPANEVLEDQRQQPRSAPAPTPAPPAAFAPESLRSLAKSADREDAKDGSRGSAAPASISIALTPASRGSSALKRLQSARPDERLKVYLDERTANAANVGFFLDAAEFFLAQGDRPTGLRVLSNLAELDLQNRDVLRLLGYRLQQADEATLAVPIFERVLELAPHEPQSQRDLGLALNLAGQPQAAIDHLYEVVTGSWDARFPDIELIALEELNAIVAQSRPAGAGLDVSRIDRRLLKTLPLDLRVVLAWDADNTDVDLHVIDPNGEEVFYGHNASYQGGTITRDATGGYGPEEFALKVAKPGKYRVEANFYGHRQQVLTSSTGLMMWLSSGFATPSQQDRRTTLRVASERGERVLVGEFEVKR